MSSALNLYRTAVARRIDEEAIAALGVSGYRLMQRAGAAAWALLRQRWPEQCRIGVVCGCGNNGGDGYVLATLARRAGCEVELVALAPPRTEAAIEACAEWERSGGRSLPWTGTLPVVGIWVDALFGIGLDRPPAGAAAALIDALNHAGRPVLALDVPSGLDADRGAAPGAAIAADATLSFLVAKRGLVTGRGRELCGDLVLDALEVPSAVLAAAPVAAVRHGRDLLAALLPPRALGSHKGNHGHVLCIGGDHGMAGAIRLSAEAALRAGAGLVSVATRGAHVEALVAARPELMARGVEGPDALAPLLERADVVALGPGLGRGDWAQALWQAVLDSGRPCVLDADGLNLLAAAPRAVPPGSILTPHPGEAARLLDCSVGDVEGDRFGALQALSERCHAAVVLKGAGSLVTAPGACPVVVGAGNPGMAVGGMGDVLCGVIAALCAQGLSAFDAARGGAVLHAAAGDLAAAHGGERGLLPMDLMPWLRRLANPGGAT